MKVIKRGSCVLSFVWSIISKIAKGKWTFYALLNGKLKIIGVRVPVRLLLSLSQYRPNHKNQILINSKLWLKGMHLLEQSTRISWGFLIWIQRSKIELLSCYTPFILITMKSEAKLARKDTYKSWKCWNTRMIYRSFATFSNRTHFLREKSKMRSTKNININVRIGEQMPMAKLIIEVWC